MKQVYNKELQDKVKKYLKDKGMSQTEFSKATGISGGLISQYLRSSYEKGNIADTEKRLEDFLKIKEEQKDSQKVSEVYNPIQSSYVPISTSEEVYKMIRYCQLEKGIVVVDGDAGIGKTKAATKFIRDNPSTTVFLTVSPSTGTLRGLLRAIAREMKLNENQRTDDLSVNIKKKLLNTDKILILDEAQHIKYLALEEIRVWVDEDPITEKSGIGIVLIGNEEIFNKMVGKQEAIFAQQFSRLTLHGRYYTTHITTEDIEKLLPYLVKNKMTKEFNLLKEVSHTKWGIRGMMKVYKEAINNKDITLNGLKLVINKKKIRLT